MIDTKERVLTVNQTDRQEVDCRHHWIIELPDGPTSPGECKFCCVTREFPNTIEGAIDEKFQRVIASMTTGYPPLELELLRASSNSRMNNIEHNPDD